MKRLTKLEIMRRNRRTMQVAALREEARELGYDQGAESEDSLELALIEINAVMEPRSVVFVRKPNAKRASLLRRMANWTMGLGPNA